MASPGVASHARLQGFGQVMVLTREWLPRTQVTPQPPAPPDGFYAALKVGVPLELNYEDGWWGVTLVQKRKPSAVEPASFLVCSAAYQTERWAEAARLRPLWTFKDGRWEAEGVPDSAGREVGAKAKAGSTAQEPDAKRSRGLDAGRGSSRGASRGAGRGAGRCTSSAASQRQRACTRAFSGP